MGSVALFGAPSSPLLPGVRMPLRTHARCCGVNHASRYRRQGSVCAGLQYRQLLAHFQVVPALGGAAPREVSPGWRTLYACVVCGGLSRRLTAAMRGGAARSPRCCPLRSGSRGANEPSDRCRGTPLRRWRRVLLSWSGRHPRIETTAGEMRTPCAAAQRGGAGHDGSRPRAIPGRTSVRGVRLHVSLRASRCGPLLRTAV